MFIPRQPSNDLFEVFEIERGVSADDDQGAKDDPGVLIHSCSFDHGLCGWIQEKHSDLHWEATGDPAGGQYLAVTAAQGPGTRAARLLLPRGHLLPEGDLCLSFRHQVSGRRGSLQVLLRTPGTPAVAVWGRTGGRGWRHTRITLRGPQGRSVVFKGERRRGHPGTVGLDDVSLTRGPCTRAQQPLR